MTTETKKRRPPGAGSVSRMRDKHQVRVTLASGQRRTIGTFADEAFADEVLHATVEELSTKAAAAVGGITLRMLGVQWLDEREERGDVRDVRNERGRFMLHIGDTPLGAMPVRAIQAIDVKGWHRELRKKKAAGTRGGDKLARKTRTEVVRILKAVFEYACSPEGGELIETSPAAWIKVKREQRTDDPWDYLREHEIPRLRACDEIPEADLLIMLFAIATGLRLGEQMNLELVDLVVDGPHPEVVVRYGSKGKPPKNGRIRRVPLFGLGLEVARRWLEILPTYAPKNPLGMVFPTSRGSRRQPGKHLHGSRWDRAKKKQIKVDRFKEHLAAAGITRPIRWHDLRHTCASMLVSGSWGRAWTLAEIGEHLGHVSRTSTERYAHLADTALRRAARETDAAAELAAEERVDVRNPVRGVREQRPTGTVDRTRGGGRMEGDNQTRGGALFRNVHGGGGLDGAAPGRRPPNIGAGDVAPAELSLEGCTTAAPVDVSVAQLLEIIAVGRQGLEPWTYGLKAPGDNEELRGDGASCSRSAAVAIPVGPRDPLRITNAEGACADAVGVLRALVRGDADAARAGGRALALQVLSTPAVRAALEVLRGGEFIDNRIAELCELVLDAGDVVATAARRSA
jgi:integrase